MNTLAKIKRQVWIFSKWACFLRLTFLGHINRRGPVFGCRAVYPLHVNSIWCRAGVHTCAVKMGLFP
ncbi:MAG: hypothetical protein V3V99_13185, partial [candidate division Zixibacteria bacterium]